MSFFSIIIPLYNKENFIENTLQSILDQSFTDFKIIIVNDGSTDASQQKVLKFNDKRIEYFFKENEGVSIARNYGISKAESKYITFIDADDYWYPDFLKTMFDTIQNYPEQKVFTAAIEVEILKKIIPSQYSIKKTGDLELVNYFTASKKQSVIFTSCAIFDQSIFDEIGDFDPKIKSGQDTDLWIRIGLKYPVLFSWKILARYVHDENSLSKNSSLLNSKMNFSKFTEDEKTNPDLKYFLDLNRFSLAIKNRLASNNSLFNYYYNGIDLKNISSKKRILLTLPSSVLKFLITINIKLVQLGIGSSVFK